MERLYSSKTGTDRTEDSQKYMWLKKHLAQRGVPDSELAGCYDVATLQAKATALGVLTTESPDLSRDLQGDLARVESLMRPDDLAAADDEVDEMKVVIVMSDDWVIGAKAFDSNPYARGGIQFANVVGTRMPHLLPLPPWDNNQDWRGAPKIGEEALQNRQFLDIHNPMSNGVVQNWEQMEQVWRHLFNSELRMVIDRTEPPEDLDASSVTVAGLTLRQDRERAFQVFFETLNAPAVSIPTAAAINGGAVGPLVSGAEEGVVLSINGATQAIPFDLKTSRGTTHAHVQANDFGGRQLTQYMSRLLQSESNCTLRSNAELKVVQQMMDSHCRVAADADTALEDDPSEFELPDDTRVQLGICRTKVPEALFCPRMTGSNALSVDELLRQAVSACGDLAYQTKLWQNVCIAGFGGVFAGLEERLERELRAKYCPTATVHRRLPGAELDGAKKFVLGRGTNFAATKVVFSDHEEVGPSLVWRRPDAQFYC